ncbi:MAG: hypothetical protein WA105_05055 [Candidatus Hydromicrobium sp.]
MKNTKQTSKYANKQANKQAKRPFAKEDYEKVLKVVTQPLKKKGKKESEKT